MSFPPPIRWSGIQKGLLSQWYDYGARGRPLAPHAWRRAIQRGICLAIVRVLSEGRHPVVRKATREERAMPFPDGSVLVAKVDHDFVRTVYVREAADDVRLMTERRVRQESYR